MKNNENKKIKASLNRNKINNKSNINIKYTNINQYTEYEENHPKTFIKSKSINKIKNKHGINMKKNLSKKMLLLKENTNNTNNEAYDSKLSKNNILNKKIKININNINNNEKKQNKLLSKHSVSSHNLKISPDYNKTKNINNINSNTNIGVVRHLDRKKIKGNKIKIKPNHGYKLFSTTKIINNFNNQINQNKSKEIINLCEDANNNNNDNEHKKIDLLYEIEEKVSKIQNCFRKHLKEEDNTHKNNENNNNNISSNNNNNNQCIEFISEISLSEEELNFSEEDSFDNMEFSLEDEEI